MLNCVFCVEEVMLAEENKNSGTSALDGKTSNALKICLPFFLPAWSWRLTPSSCDGRSGKAPVGSAAQARGEGRWIGTVIPERAWRLGGVRSHARDSSGLGSPGSLRPVSRPEY